MHSMAVRAFKTLSAFALVGLASTLMAQAPVTDANPVFTIDSVQSPSGQDAVVKVYVTGGVSNTAAINFTIQVDGDDLSHLDGNLTGIIAPELASSYTMEDNNVGSGEYRAVIYPTPGGSASPFNTESMTHVASITVPIAAGVADDTEINLAIVNEFDDDGVTGLVGISNSLGSTVVNGAESPSAGGTRNIGKEDGSIIIVNFGGPTDFTKSDEIFPGWEAQQILPVVIRDSRVVSQLLPTVDSAFQAGDIKQNFTQTEGTGIVSSTIELNTFGFLITADANPRMFASPGAGKVLTASYTVASNASDPNDTAKIRLRSNIDGYSEGTIYQEPQVEVASQGNSTVPDAADGAVTLSQMAFAHESASNGVNADRDGFIISFDVETTGTVDAFKIGFPGNEVTVSQLMVSSMDPAALGTGTEIVNFDFSAGDANGFTPFGSTAGQAGIVGTVLADTSAGLSLSPQPDSAVAGGLAFGFFRNDGVFTADSSKIYKTEFVVASTATDKVSAGPVARLRIDVSEVADQPEFVKEAVVESSGAGADSSYLPTDSGTTYTTFFQVPAAMDGESVSVFFDSFSANTAVDGAVILKSLTVTEYTP